MQYAAKVMGVDSASILSEVDHVGNGFISVVGLPLPEYSVVAILWLMDSGRRSSFEL